MPHRLVVPIIDRPGEYLFGLEQFDDTTFVHLTIGKWNSRIAKQMLQDANEAHLRLNRPVYAVPPPDADAKYFKFLKLCGFRPCGTCDSAGVERPLYVRTLD